MQEGSSYEIYKKKRRTGGAYFEANHRHIRGDEYEQLPHTIKVWQAGDGSWEELDFLLSTGRLVLCPADEVPASSASIPQYRTG